MPESERKTWTTLRGPRSLKSVVILLLLGLEGWGAEGWKWTVKGRIPQLIIFHKSIGENKMKIPFMECLREQLSIVLTHGRWVKNCCIKISGQWGADYGSFNVQVTWSSFSQAGTLCVSYPTHSFHRLLSSTNKQHSWGSRCQDQRCVCENIHLVILKVVCACVRVYVSCAAHSYMCKAAASRVDRH